MVYHWTLWNSPGIDLEDNGSEFMGSVGHCRSERSELVGTDLTWLHWEQQVCKKFYTWDITAFIPLTKLEYYCEK